MRFQPDQQSVECGGQGADGDGVVDHVSTQGARLKEAGMEWREVAENGVEIDPKMEFAVGECGLEVPCGRLEGVHGDPRLC